MESEKMQEIIVLGYRLEAILIDELTGAPFDREEASRLATALTELCPTISYSLRRVSDRMGHQRLANVA